MTKTIIKYLTNRFHVAVRLFSNRSQMASKCGKNKKVAHEAQPSVPLFCFIYLLYILLFYIFILIIYLYYNNILIIYLY